MLEIERTWLVKKIPSDLAKFSSKKIKQGYISHLPFPLRIRQIGDKFELTKKFMVGKDISIMEEVNLPLTEAEFVKLWPLCESSLEKTRYYIPIHNNLTAELDVFENNLAGYQVVEVEFKSEDEMNNFVAPEWFGKDISTLDIASSRKLSMMDINKVLSLKEEILQG